MVSTTASTSSDGDGGDGDGDDGNWGVVVVVGADELRAVVGEGLASGTGRRATVGEAGADAEVACESSTRCGRAAGGRCSGGASSSATQRAAIVAGLVARARVTGADCGATTGRGAAGGVGCGSGESCGSTRGVVVSATRGVVTGRVVVDEVEV